MFERISYDRGVHLRGTPLWFDAERKRELCVLTGLYGRIPPLHKRTVAGPELVTALAKLGYRAVLPAPWDRWVGLGGCQVKLVSAGVRPGAACATVARGKELVVVAGLLRHEVITWPRADQLVAVVPALAHRGGARDQVMRGLEMFVDQAEADGARGVVLVDTGEVGLEVYAGLAARGRLLRPTGVLGKLVEQPDLPHTRVALALAGSRVSDQARVAWVDTGVNAWAGARQRRPPAATFRLKFYADWSTLRHAVSMTGAAHVSLVAPGGATQEIAAQYLGSGVDVRLLGAAEQLDLVSA
jgi:hypothetical protein